MMLSHSNMDEKNASSGQNLGKAPILYEEAAVSDENMQHILVWKLDIG